MRILSTWALASNLLVLASGLALSGCVGEPPVELSDDPAAALGDEEWLDDGPPPGEEAIDEELGSTSDGVSNMPAFQLPFPCGQIWAGQTRTNHSPLNSIDFNRSDDIGDAVVASAGGKVTRVANEGNTSYGRWIEIDHGNGYRSRYAHLNSQIVSVGQSVSKGQKIGTVGSTGGSSGPHLHYEVRRNGVAIRPVFNGATAYFYGTKNYTSKNSCGGGGGGGGGVTGTVNTSGAALTIRADASTSSAAVGSVPDGAKVTITCQKKGTSVTGTYGTSTLWDYIGSGYIADAYVHTGSDGQVAPTCK
ncbi:M23 family metallopeptidase [Polyangium spumosum]|nr:M23 family metallopeptidase [Polyangium spumosum]